MPAFNNAECPVMLNSIRLQNFKSYRDSGEIPIRPLTVIIGCNNAGKSAIVQPLLALKQTLLDPSWRSRLVTSGPLVDLGGFYDIVHGMNNDHTIKFEFGRDIGQGTPVPDRVEFREPTKLGLEFGFNKKASSIEVRSLTLSDSGGIISEFHERPEEWKVESLRKAQRKYLSPVWRNFLIGMKMETPKVRQFTDRTASLFDQFMVIETQFNLWHSLFRSVVHVSPLRSRIPWYCGIARRSPSESGLSGENLVRTLSSEESTEGTKQTLLRRVDEWMSGRMGTLSNLRLKAIDDANLVLSLIADDPGGHEAINIAAMGEGVSQVLPIVSTAFDTRKNDTLVIEQPEIHLHPKAQADLGDLFIASAKVGRRVIVETHSEHILLRIRRRIAEGKCSPKDVAVLFVEKSGGQSKVQRLEVNERGHFDRWPKGFFDEAYQEAMALAMASPSPKKGGA